MVTAKRWKEPVRPRIPEVLTEAVLPRDEPVDDGILLSLAFGALELGGAVAENVEFERCRFTKTVLAGGEFTRARLEDVAFAGCDLANLRMTGSRFLSVDVVQSRMTGTKLGEARLANVVFEECRANLASFRFGQLKDVVFRNCDLSEADFQNAELSGVRFEGCKLVAAQFSNATMRATRFSGCDLFGVGGVQSFRGAVVSSADAPGLVHALAAAMGIEIED